MSAVPKLSSSLVLLRRLRGSTTNEFEVLMTRRSEKMRAFKGMFVFPGGVAESEDEAMEAKFPATSANKGIMRKEKITALRELFEEVGVLLTKSKTECMTHPVRMIFTNRIFWQAEVHKNPSSYETLLKEFDATPPLDDIFYLCTFITPTFEQKRFRANFFVSIVDDAAAVQLDGGETVEYKWVTPKDAIKLYSSGNMPFLPPQMTILNVLGKLGSIDKVIEAVKQERIPSPIQPHLLGQAEKGMILAFPGDAEHHEFPSPNSADRNRVHYSVPFGQGDVVVECTIPDGPFYFGSQKSRL